MNYVPLGTHTHFSLLKSSTKPENLAKRLEALDMKRCGITDFHSVSGMVQCIDKLKGVGSYPILGSKINFCENPIVLAKNLQGWKNLIKLLSVKSITIDDIAKYSAGCIFIATYDMLTLMPQLHDVFGKDLYGCVQLAGEPDLHRSEIVRTQFDVKKVAVPHSLYLNKEDAYDNRILFCVGGNTTLSKLKYSNNYYCTGDNFFLPSYDEALAMGYTKDELAMTLEIAEKCEEIKITGKPILPNFPCPDKMTPDEYMRALCNAGWKRRIEGKIDMSRRQEYIDRAKHELEVLQGVELSPYFLVVQDILQYIESKHWLKGPARGSSAGCLTSYLLNITDIDPMPYDLLFERFYNAGRNTADKVTLPDIDIDVPKHKREEIIQYIYDKYGSENCGQIITYQTLMGRAVLKAVFAAHGDMSFGEILSITEHIPDKAKIADELEEMKEQGEVPSIVLWALEQKAEKFKEFARLEDGKIVGPLAGRFEQAIRLEGLKTHASRHASGIIIAPSPLENYCQVMHLKDASVCCFEMNDAEAIGLLKLDILGLNTLDKLTGISSILAHGDIYENYELPD